MSKVPGDSPSSASNFPPRTPYVYTGRTVRVESEDELKTLPRGAIRLTRREVIRAADHFKTRKEFRAYRELEEWWPVASGITCCVSSIYVISLVRHKFKLGRYHARAIHYISGSAFPTIFVPIACIPLVQESAIIKETSCPDCLGIRSGLIQFAGGMIWASAMAVVGAMYYAKRYHTVPLPPISPRYFKDYRKIIAQPFKPAIPYLFVQSLMQFAVGYVGGIKFWYRGQEMNAVDNYVAMKTMEMSPGGGMIPQFVPVKVQTDRFTEMIATGNLFGKAVAKDAPEEEEGEESDGYLYMFSSYIRRMSKWLFGSSVDDLSLPDES